MKITNVEIKEGSVATCEDLFVGLYYGILEYPDYMVVLKTDSMYLRPRRPYEDRRTTPMDRLSNISGQVASIAQIARHAANYDEFEIELALQHEVPTFRMLYDPEHLPVPFAFSFIDPDFHYEVTNEQTTFKLPICYSESAFGDLKSWQNALSRRRDAIAKCKPYTFPTALDVPTVGYRPNYLRSE